MPSVNSAALSILVVVTVLKIKGILCSKAAFAKISGEFGHIKPCNPTGAIPKGASYSIPKSFVLVEDPP